MKRFIHLPSFMIFIFLVLILGWVANSVLGISYWVALGVIAFAIFINGILIAFEKLKN